MLTNRTFMSNDSVGTAVNVPNEATCDATGQVRFWQNITKTTAATNDSNAKFVEVQVDSRRAYFALTPIVGALGSGQMRAVAFAGLDSAICKVPPLMLCNPNESGDPDFTVANYVGKGIRLVANDGGPIYGPGNFGFLDVGAGNGASTLRMVLGRTNVPGDCVSGSTVATETGNMITVRDALNTRFDVYDNGLNQACGNTGVLCPPSTNTRKDLVRKGNGCGYVTQSNQNGWQEASNAYSRLTFSPSRSLTDTEITNLPPMGYPRDECHNFSVTGDCAPVVGGVGNRIGNGAWDRYAYFKSNSTNYPTITSVSAMNTFLTSTFGTTTPTRFQVYQWEMQNAATRLQQQGAGASLTSYSQPICTPPGLAPSATQVDRRMLSVAVVNCTAEGVGGHTTGINVTKWIDIFLVEPAVTRSHTENSDVYVEIIGATENATDEGAVQLVKKSVPYLIE
jgi:hypothetical protein